MSDLLTRVRQYIDSEALLAEGDRVMAGVSGGADSMCLLAVLEAVCRERDLPLLAVHINHMIRGAEADADEAFVREYCAGRGIAFAAERADIPSEAARRQLSEEETGRLVRGEIFERLMDERGFTKLALAHQRNDLAETMLFNMARGTGLSGLASLRSRRGNVIRPLLCADRCEIEEYLAKEGIPFRNDSTNSGDDHTRNRIRHHVLPYLTGEVNDRALRHMAALAETTAETVDYIRREAAKRLEPHLTALGADGRALAQDAAGRPPVSGAGGPEAAGYRVGRAFFKEDPVIIKAGIMELLERLNAPRRDVGRVHLDAVLDLAQGPSGRHLDLPGVTADKTREGLILKRTTREEARRRLGR